MLLYIPFLSVIFVMTNDFSITVLCLFLLQNFLTRLAPPLGSCNGFARNTITDIIGKFAYRSFRHPKSVL